MHPDQTLESLIFGWDLGRFFWAMAFLMGDPAFNRGLDAGP